MVKSRARIGKRAPPLTPFLIRSLIALSAPLSRSMLGVAKSQSSAPMHLKRGDAAFFGMIRRGGSATCSRRLQRLGAKTTELAGTLGEVVVPIVSDGGLAQTQGGHRVE